MGKTSLLDVLAGMATEAGARVVRLDGRNLPPSPSAVLDELRAVLDVPDGEGAIVGPSGTGRVVVVIDTYERLAAVDDWVRSWLFVAIQRLPAEHPNRGFGPLRKCAISSVDRRPTLRRFGLNRQAGHRPPGIPHIRGRHPAHSPPRSCYPRIGVRPTRRSAAARPGQARRCHLP
jgi:hypothetical protein